MEEGAALTELAFSGFFPILAGSRLVVRVHGTESSLAKVFGQRIIWLSQIFLAMSKLAVLGERALLLFEVMLAQLSFVFLFERIELTLVSVEIIVVRLLGQVTHHFSWGIVEISWPSISIETLGFIARLFAR